MFELRPSSIGTERRTSPREPVRHPTRWDHRRLENQIGELRDITTEGLFIRPQGGTVRFRPNDVILGSVHLRGETRIFRAVVRWRGWSVEHRCVGLGLELEAQSRFTDEEIRAVRWPQDATGRPLLQVLERLEWPG